MFVYTIIHSVSCCTISGGQYRVQYVVYVSVHNNTLYSCCTTSGVQYRVQYVVYVGVHNNTLCNLIVKHQEVRTQYNICLC